MTCRRPAGVICVQGFREKWRVAYQQVEMFVGFQLRKTAFLKGYSGGERRCFEIASCVGACAGIDFYGRHVCVRRALCEHQGYYAASGADVGYRFRAL